MNAIFYTPPLENAHIADILQEIYLKGLYEPYLRGRKDLTILDIGANVGIFSLYASEFGTCYAFEPAQEHIESMNKMIETNGLKDKVNVYRAAISNVDGITNLNHNGNVTAHSLSNALVSTGESESVPTWTMKKLFDELKLEKVDFMKLDVEGWEFNILASKEFEEVAPKIDTIVGEYHTWTNTNPSQLITMLKDYGYDAGWTDKTTASTFYATRK